MKYPLISGSALLLIVNAIVQCEGKPDIGDYIVDCSACNSVPVQGISSYSCKIKCSAEGECVENISACQYAPLVGLKAYSCKIKCDAQGGYHLYNL